MMLGYRASKPLAVAIATLALLAGAAPAHGAPAHRGKGYVVYAPPGKAGATEYSEDVPTSGGNVAPPANLSTPSPTSLDHLGQGRKGARTLSKLGKDGLAATNWARATAPAVSGISGSAARSLGGGSALSGLLHLLGGSDADGIGAVLPLLLALTLVGTLGFAAGRRFKPSRT